MRVINIGKIGSTGLCWLGQPYDRKSEGSFCLHWHGSDYADGTWYHEVSLTGAADTESGSLDKGALWGQKYGAKSDDNGDMSITVNNDYFGHYPPESGDPSLPDWMQPVFEEAVGTLSTGAGWFLAVGEAFNEKVDHHDDGIDQSYYPNGFRYRNTIDKVWDDPYTEMCFTQRFNWNMDSIDTEVDTYTEWGYDITSFPYSTKFTGVGFKLDFFGSGEPDESDALSDFETDLNVSQARSAANDPHNASERVLADLGIKRVEGDTDRTITVDGEEKTPEFVATRPLVSIKEMSVKKSREDEEGVVKNEETLATISATDVDSTANRWKEIESPSNGNRTDRLEIQVRPNF